MERWRKCVPLDIQINLITVETKESETHFGNIVLFKDFANLVTANLDKETDDKDALQKTEHSHVGVNNLELQQEILPYWESHCAYRDPALHPGHTIVLVADRFLIKTLLLVKLPTLKYVIVSRTLSSQRFEPMQTLEWNATHWYQ